MDETTIWGIAVGAWGNRYTRRRNVLEGRAGWADPTSDSIACALLMDRNARRDAAIPVPPGMGGSMGWMLELSYRNTYSVGVDEPHRHGPSFRALWAEGAARGGPEIEVWRHIAAWGHNRPESFASEALRIKRGRPPLGAQAECLERRIDWTSTGDLERPWRAKVDNSTWEVRLNDFPDAVMYSLLVDGRELGDFPDWPAGWGREGQPALAPALPRVVASDAAGRWLDRYRAGECEAVWAEMIALGPDIRSNKALEPARAVATETMRRARTNIERLLPRLARLGYEFHSRQEDVFIPAAADTAARLSRLERKGILLPLSLQAWLTEVGRVDLSGSHAALAPAGFGAQLPDPLSVIPMIDEVEEETGAWTKAEGLQALPLVLSFAPSGKAVPEEANGDEVYELMVPDPAADASISGEAHDLGFVDYLRRSFRYGGFAGWADSDRRPTAELRVLTEGLLPL